MEQFQTPFSLPMTPEAFKSHKSGKYILRRLSDLKDHYSARSAVEQILMDEDPIIYEFWEHEYIGPGRGLSLGLTCIHPGMVGNEYYQTKGHFHVGDVGDEIYHVLEGQGFLLLYSKAGKQEVIRMVPGTFCYIPGTMAHRTVNIGSKNLVFASIWPPLIEHDYEIIVKKGFPKLVVEGPDGAILIENPSFNSDLLKTQFVGSSDE
jgi:glucose-6-phosphate isomerase